MHINYYFLKHLSASLNFKLEGMELAACYTQDKNEIILYFTGKGDEFSIKAQLDGEVALLSFPDDLRRARKNSADLFKSLVGTKVDAIRQFKNERAFSIEFGEQQLLFKLHGRRANIVLCRNGQAVELFKSNLVSDKELDLSSLDRELDQTQANIIDSDFDLKSIFPTFGKRIIQYLKSSNFENSTTSQRTGLLESLLKTLEEKEFYIFSEDGIPYLSMIPSENTEPIYTSNDPIETCSVFARQFSYSFQLRREKNSIQTTLLNSLKKHKSYIAKLSKRLVEIDNAPKHQEIANILMANLHLQMRGASSIELFDFYRNENIVIKLKKDLSLQKNAENFYRKGKNQSIEVRNLKSNIEHKTILLEEAQQGLSRIDAIDDIKTLRKEFNTGPTKASAKKEELPKPYIEVILNDYKILVGKNAKSNDILLQQYTSKNDLWLHARNVSGSHVIIKERPGSQYPKDIIEKAAQLAAWYSKGKSDTLCPVIYTPRKYVRKPKGALPGQVLLQQEEVILVKPCQKVQ